MVEEDPNLTENETAVAATLPPENAAAEEDATYPKIKILGEEGKLIPSYLCQSLVNTEAQVVQRRFSTTFTAQIPDLVEGYLASLGRLLHPNLAPLLDFGWERSDAFLIRPYIQGPSLAQAQAKLSLAQQLQIFYQILSALTYLEAQSVPHLNLHPENIFLSQDSQGKLTVQITDFGLQPLLHRLPPGEVESLGRPPYTSPDYILKPQLASQHDLYSVGILLYQTLTGQLPFMAESPSEIIQKQLHETLTPLHSIQKNLPPQLSDLVSLFCSRDPKRRLPHLAAALQVFCQLAEGMVNLEKQPPLLPFADGNVFFRAQEMNAWFQQLLISGGRWAFTGPAGSGKTFMARALQRFLNFNHQTVRFLNGSQMAALEGETFLRPGEIVFIIVDDADQGPSSAWLNAHPYQHWIIFGNNLNWVKQDKAWRHFALQDLTSTQIQAAFASLGIEMPGPLTFKRPWELLRQTQALTHHQILSFKAGQFQGEAKQAQAVLSKMQQNLASISVAGSELEFYVPKELQTLIALISLAKIPLSTATLMKLLKIEEATLQDLLRTATAQGLIERRLLLGNEIFKIAQPLSANYAKYISEETFRALLLEFKESTLAAAGLKAIEKYFPQQAWQKDAELILWASYFLLKTENYTAVFKYLQASFVKTLANAELKARAYEILGYALRKTGKHPQADAALKQAFTAYRNLKDPEGQTRVLLDFAQFYAQEKDTAKAVKFLEQAAAVAKNCPESSSLAGEINWAIGEFYRQNQDISTALPYLDTAIAELYRTQDYSTLAHTYLSYAQALFQQGDQASADYFLHEMLTLAQFRGLYALAAQGFLLMAQLSANQNNQSRILERIGEAIEMLSHVKAPVLMAQALIERSYLYEFNREQTLAQKDIGQAMLILKEHHAAEWIAPAQLVLGKILRRDIEKQTQATKHFLLAKKHYSQAASQKWAWECDYELGEIANTQGKPLDAQQHYQAAMRSLQDYLSDLSHEAQQEFLQDGKRERIQAALNHQR